MLISGNLLDIFATGAAFWRSHLPAHHSISGISQAMNLFGSVEPFET
jgi:hypothetical protein